jgi:hypothetical protein
MYNDIHIQLIFVLLCILSYPKLQNKYIFFVGFLRCIFYLSFWNQSHVIWFLKSWHVIHESSQIQTMNTGTWLLSPVKSCISQIPFGFVYWYCFHNNFGGFIFLMSWQWKLASAWLVCLLLVVSGRLSLFGNNV